MTKVTAQMSVSLDGYYAGPRSTADPHDMAAWMEGLEAPGFFRVTRWVIDAMAWRERLGFAGGEQSVAPTADSDAAGAARCGRSSERGGAGTAGALPADEFAGAADPGGDAGSSTPARNSALMPAASVVPTCCPSGRTTTCP